MTRKIKFRAWDKEKKVMSIIRSWDFAHGDIELGKELSPEADKFEEDVIIQQFTGLHDKLGKEIYGGDLINWIEEDLGEGNIVKSKGEVSFSNGSFIVNGCPLSSYYNDDNSSFEIIGNIYENPDLL